MKRNMYESHALHVCVPYSVHVTSVIFEAVKGHLRFLEVNLETM